MRIDLTVTYLSYMKRQKRSGEEYYIIKALTKDDNMVEIYQADTSKIEGLDRGQELNLTADINFSNNKIFLQLAD